MNESEELERENEELKREIERKREKLEPQTERLPKGSSEFPRAARVTRGWGPAIRKLIEEIVEKSSELRANMEPAIEHLNTSHDVTLDRLHNELWHPMLSKLTFRNHRKERKTIAALEKLEKEVRNSLNENRPDEEVLACRRLLAAARRARTGRSPPKPRILTRGARQARTKNRRSSALMSYSHFRRSATLLLMTGTGTDEGPTLARTCPRGRPGGPCRGSCRLLRRQSRRSTSAVGSAALIR